MDVWRFVGMLGNAGAVANAGAAVEVLRREQETAAVVEARLAA